MNEKQSEQKEGEGQANVGSGAVEHRRKNKRQENDKEQQATLQNETGQPPHTATATIPGGLILISF